MAFEDASPYVFFPQPGGPFAGGSIPGLPITRQPQPVYVGPPQPVYAPMPMPSPAYFPPPGPAPTAGLGGIGSTIGGAMSEIINLVIQVVMIKLVLQLLGGLFGGLTGGGGGLFGGGSSSGAIDPSTAAFLASRDARTLGDALDDLDDSTLNSGDSDTDDYIAALKGSLLVYIRGVERNEQLKALTSGGSNGVGLAAVLAA